MHRMFEEDDKYYPIEPREKVLHFIIKKKVQ